MKGETKMKQTSKDIPVLVSDAHRGVFFGYVSPANLNAKAIRIKRARMVIYWSADVKGFSGLAANGPSATCRIGPAVIAITIQDVVSVTELSSESAEKFEVAPWSL